VGIAVVSYARVGFTQDAPRGKLYFAVPSGDLFCRMPLGVAYWETSTLWYVECVDEGNKYTDAFLSVRVDGDSVSNVGG
jgi:hypothetical protein